jgi:hypothetical protein
MATPREVPLQEARRSTRTTVKLWRDLIEVRLMKPARRGGRNGFVITGDQFDHLKAIASARSQIDGRFTLGKLAFELADGGCRWVPTELVQKEVRGRVDSLLGFWRRWIQRYLGLPPQLHKITEPKIMEAAKKFALRATRKMPKRYRSSAYDAAFVLLAIFLKMMYLRKSNPMEHVRILKELVLQTGAVDLPDKGHIGFSFQGAQQLANQFASTLPGLSAVLTFDKSVNILFKAGLKPIPDDEFWKAFDAGRRADTMFWEAYDDLRQIVKLDRFSDEQRVTLRPLFIGTILALQAHPPKDVGMLEELLSGDDHGFKQLLRNQVEAVRQFLKLQPLLAAAREKKHVK